MALLATFSLISITLSWRNTPSVADLPDIKFKPTSTCLLMCLFAFGPTGQFDLTVLGRCGLARDDLVTAGVNSTLEGGRYWYFTLPHPNATYIWKTEHDYTVIMITVFQKSMDGTKSWIERSFQPKPYRWSAQPFPPTVESTSIVVIDMHVVAIKTMSFQHRKSTHHTHKLKVFTDNYENILLLEVFDLYAR